MRTIEEINAVISELQQVAINLGASDIPQNVRAQSRQVLWKQINTLIRERNRVQCGMVGKEQPPGYRRPARDTRRFGG